MGIVGATTIWKVRITESSLFINISIHKKYILAWDVLLCNKELLNISLEQINVWWIELSGTTHMQKIAGSLALVASGHVNSLGEALLRGFFLWPWSGN